MDDGDLEASARKLLIDTQRFQFPMKLMPIYPVMMKSLWSNCTCHQKQKASMCPVHVTTMS
eukprot:7059460-Karenia_brevis.AAC.1